MPLDIWQYDLIRGNYASRDEDLPRGWGYQNVGTGIETGPDCKELKVGDVVYMSQDHMQYSVTAEDGLLVKLPPEVDLRHAALFGIRDVEVAAQQVGSAVLRRSGRRVRGTGRSDRDCARDWRHRRY